MLKIVHISGIEVAQPKKLTAKQKFDAFADSLRMRMEYKNRVEAEKEYPKYLEEARKKLNQK